MKKKRTAPQRKPVPRNPDEIQQYVQTLYDEHQQEWQSAILDPAPDWPFLLALHLRMIELDHLETAVQELQ
jgi:hypothetical protein